MKEITSKDNAAIKQAIKLKQKKYRQQEGLFLVEGHKMLRELLLCPEFLIRVFLTRETAESYNPALSNLSGVECLLIDERLMGILCDTETPQGIAALARIPQPDVQSLSRPEGLLLLLDQIQDPGNMGTIIRTAWGFAVDGILLTGDCVDPFGPKAVRSSMGGIFHVPVLAGVGLDLLADFRAQGYRMLGSVPGAADSLFDQDFTGSTIIVIGNESRGISAEVRGLCDNCFKIPINPQADSLNAAMACAIITVEALRQRSCGLLS